jgi:type IV secretory pathway VirB3-like protein
MFPSLSFSVYQDISPSTFCINYWSLPSCLHVAMILGVYTNILGWHVELKFFANVNLRQILLPASVYPIFAVLSLAFHNNQPRSWSFWTHLPRQNAKDMRFHFWTNDSLSPSVCTAMYPRNVTQMHLQSLFEIFYGLVMIFCTNSENM